MATYAIGDVHGCWRTLQDLLDRVAPTRDDRLWLVGDIVNRGPGSLECLRWAREQGDRIVLVLGNHDVHLLARAQAVRRDKPRDTFDDILAAPDRDELVAWLAERPLVHREGEHLLVHAGLHPVWTFDVATRLARAVEQRLRAPDRAPFLAALYEEEYDEWRADLAGDHALRAALRVLVSVRAIDGRGRLRGDFAGHPAEAPEGCRAWYTAREDDGLAGDDREGTVVFGHWAALGFLRRPGFLGLDTGCAWGGELTAVRLDDGERFAAPRVD